MVLPSLALAIGNRPAAILQQVHNSMHSYKGEKWFYRSAEEWHAGEFKYLSLSTINRAISTGLKKGLIKKAFLGSKFGKSTFDRTLYYTINYEEMAKLESEIFSKPNKDNNMEMHLVKLTKWIMSI
jgi:hypothetical protein